jgi:protein TonB
MKIILTALFLGLTVLSNAQNNQNLTSNDTNVTKVDTTLFTRVDVEATYPGGQEAWINFLQNNLDASVPVRKKAPVGQYTVYVQFIVDKDGKASDIKALTNHGYGMEKEVMRIIKKAGKWIPAEMNGRKVKAYRKQPITFQVSAK